MPDEVTTSSHQYNEATNPASPLPSHPADSSATDQAVAQLSKQIPFRGLVAAVGLLLVGLSLGGEFSWTGLLVGPIGAILSIPFWMGREAAVSLGTPKKAFRAWMICLVVTALSGVSIGAMRNLTYSQAEICAKFVHNLPLSYGSQGWFGRADMQSSAVKRTASELFVPDWRVSKCARRLGL